MSPSRATRSDAKRMSVTNQTDFEPYSKDSTPIGNIPQLQRATFCDPTDADSRINTAGLRLIVADDGNNVFQRSRAIYDCSAALYYGPPSFKVYYRRGYALAYLDMWDKAILREPNAPPQLPAFLTEPLKCPVGRCNALGTPLPPIPAKLAALLPEYFIEHLRDEFRFIGTQRAAKIDESVIDFILRRVKAQPPNLWVSQTKSESPAGPREVKELYYAVEDLTMHFMDSLRVLAGKAICKFNEEGRKTDGCLHDFLDPSLDGVWEHVTRRDHCFDPKYVRSQQYDPAPLFERISTAIANEDISNVAGWGEQEDWRKDVLVMRTERLSELRLGEVFVDDLMGQFDRLGYRSVLERPGAILGMVSHLLPAFGNPQLPISHLSQAVQFQQLTHFCESLPSVRQSILSASPSLYSSESAAGSESAAPESTPTVPTTPIAAFSIKLSDPKCSPTAFDRFEKVKTTGKEQHPLLIRLVQARMCPPDRCSGRAPNVAKYETVDLKIQELFALAVKWHSLQMVHESRIMVYGRILFGFACYFDWLESAGPTKYDQLLIFLSEAACNGRIEMKSVSAHVAINGAFVKLAAYLRKAKQMVFGDSKTFPCLCDLTHMCSPLEKIRREETKKYDAELERLCKSALSESYSRDSLYSQIEKATRQGIFPERVWSGSWRISFGLMVDVVHSHAIKRLYADHERWTRGITEHFDQVSSSVVMEEVALYPNVPNPAVTKVWVEHFMLLGMKNLSTTTSAGATDVGNLYFSGRGPHLADGLERLRESIGAYHLAFFLDPSDAVARLNCATARLCGADDTSQAIQWTRAIYDCTMAIYYGCDSWKAYYRRGYALAHLKMWEKAILDYEDALVIDPGNVRVVQCMDAAKRKVPVE